MNERPVQSPPSSEIEVADADELLDRGIASVEEDDLDAAERILDKAREIRGENDPRVLHLAGLATWAAGDIDRACGFLMQAVDQQPERFDIYLDCAECLFVGGEISEAEAKARVALSRERLTDMEEAEATLLLAQVRLADQDPEEALELLGSIDSSLHDHPAWVLTKSSALIDFDRTKEAVELLQGAVKGSPDNGDLHYNLAEALETDGDGPAAREHMLQVLRLDAASADPALAEASPADVTGIVGALEEALNQLPDPILDVVGKVPIEVSRRATEAEVGQGVDPRDVVYFVWGPPKKEGEEDVLLRIGVSRDRLLEEVDSEEDIEMCLFESLVEQIEDSFDGVGSSSVEED